MFCLIFHNCSRSVRYTAYGTYYPCQYLRTGKSGDTWHMSYGTNNQSTAEWRSASHTNLTLGKQERTRSHRCTNGLNYRMDYSFWFNNTGRCCYLQIWLGSWASFPGDIICCNFRQRRDVYAFQFYSRNWRMKNSGHLLFQVQRNESYTAIRQYNTKVYRKGQ